MIIAPTAIENEQVAEFKSHLGWMAVHWRSEKVFRLVFGYRNAADALSALALSDRRVQTVSPGDFSLVEKLLAYAEGDPVEFDDVEVDWSGCTRFQLRVLRACRAIPRGVTRSYGQLASAAGSPQAARAVGNTMARNRVPLIVPCHRVVGSAGALGGFSAPDGLDMKHRLLQLEDADILHGRS